VKVQVLRIDQDDAVDVSALTTNCPCTLLHHKSIKTAPSGEISSMGTRLGQRMGFGGIGF